MSNQVATGFDFQPLPNGNVLIEFCDDQGTTVNTQIITAQALVRLPLVAFITLTAINLGAEAAAKLLPVMDAAEELEAEDGSNQ
ncbi:MAG: hypothetical protein GXY83_34165 [Rhodopirellula sp.]|nr:hypothetical protein [Rhodopirellula sp.]